ncbi:MAG: MlaD family protein [Mariprofundaceae bacterium]
MNAQARLGAFVLIGLMLFIFATNRVGDMIWVQQKNHIVETEFDDLLGLNVQSPVLMAGVKVGIVQEILLRNHRAVVRIALNPEVRIPASTRASIIGRGMVGEKNISLKAKPGDTEWLPDDATIPSDASGDLSTLIAKSSAMMADIRKLSSTLTEMFSDDTRGASLKSILKQTHQAVTQLNHIMSENRSDLRNTMQNISQTSDILSKELPKTLKEISKATQHLPATLKASKEFFEKSDETITHIDATIIDNRENLYRMLFELRKASENLESLSDDLRRNPWKLMKEKKEIPLSKKKQQAKMEEMLLKTGQMGIRPAQR